MARVPMVTRTIQTTKVVALCVDISTSQTSEKEYILPGTYKDDLHTLKALAKLANDDNNKVVHIKHAEVYNTLYGMSENDFIANAKVLPPRTVKELDAE